MLKYFASITDEGIVVKASSSIDDFRQPREWREVGDIRSHVFGDGLSVLGRGGRIVFTQSDQSYPRLNSLFSS